MTYSHTPKQFQKRTLLEQETSFNFIKTNASQALLQNKEIMSQWDQIAPYRFKIEKRISLADLSAEFCVTFERVFTKNLNSWRRASRLGNRCRILPVTDCLVANTFCVFKRTRRDLNSPRGLLREAFFPSNVQPPASD